jgi:hypothetical protein
MVILKKTMMVVAILYFLGTLGMNTYMELTYSADMPRVPDFAAGRTRPLSVNHSRLVYVNDAEYRAKKNTEHFFFWGAPFAFALIALLKLHYKVF